MSLSRLSGLVALLVLGTALSVWWYLQVPAAAGPGERREPVAVEELEEACPDELDVPATPDSTAAPESERWTRRIRPAGAAIGTRRTQAGGATSGVGLQEASAERRCSKSAPAAPPAPAAASIDGPGS